MGNVNNELYRQLETTFPDPVQQNFAPLEIEKKVEDCMSSLLLKGFQCLDLAGRVLSGARSVYRAAWIPYYILRSPFAYTNKLHETSAEKNLDILVNVTAANVVNSVITPSVARRKPWLSCSSENAFALSRYLSGASLLFPFVYAPAYQTFSCIRHSNGVNTLDIKQIQIDIGRCLNDSSKVYQGPEAIVGIATSLALGILFGTVSYALLYLLLNDSDREERYKKLDKLYTDVAMLQKNRWDDAVKDNNKEAMKQCVETATKLSTNIDLISTNIELWASLTSQQVLDIKHKLSWSCNYVLKQDKPAV